jgi:hypothetical protein
MIDCQFVEASSGQAFGSSSVCLPVAGERYSLQERLFLLKFTADLLVKPGFLADCLTWMQLKNVKVVNSVV